jgi:putative DNA primase/helicase
MSREKEHPSAIVNEDMSKSVPNSPQQAITNTASQLFGADSEGQANGTSKPRSKRKGTGKNRPHTFPHTDAGNAEMFAAYWEDDVRFDHKQQRWLIWNRTKRRWKQDMQGRVRLLMKETARQRARIAVALRSTESNKDWKKQEFKWALNSEDRYRIDAALELAKSEPPISDTGDAWDSDEWLFGVANGIVDLRTGKLRAATQANRITKFSPVAFDAVGKCPRFEQFLSEIFGCNRGLIRYVQKAVGYSLTGSTREQCLFASYGAGANGKTTLYEIILYLMGDYGVDLPFSALEAKRNATAGDGVNLPGARFVKAVEIREDRRLDEARVKAWTGSDTISIRPLYRNSFSFEPTHKLWLGFNHKPRITDDSPAMWRRIRLIPFQHTFEGNQADKLLLEKLKAEAPGILNWAIEGCLVWQREGLETPVAVERATREYEQESDVVGPFLGDCCVISPATCVPSSELWNAYLKWAKMHGERELSRNAFADHLKKRGFTSGEEGHDKRWVWSGLALRLEWADAGARVRAGADSQDFSISTSSIG